jgi:hypothetical protein
MLRQKYSPGILCHCTTACTFEKEYYFEKKYRFETEMKTCPKCSARREDDSFKARNGRIVSHCSVCRQATNAAQSRRRRAAANTSEAGPSRKRQRTNQPSSSDHESRYRLSTPGSSGEQRARRQVSTTLFLLKAQLQL